MVFQSASPSKSATALERRRSSWADHGRPVILSAIRPRRKDKGECPERQLALRLACKLAKTFKSGIRRDDVMLSESTLSCLNYVIINSLPSTPSTCLWFKAIPPMKKTSHLHYTMLSTWLPYLQLKGTGSSPPRPPPFLKLLLTYLHKLVYCLSQNTVT